MTTHRNAILAALALGALALAPYALAQSDEPATNEPATPTDQTPERDVLRSRIQSQLEALQMRENQLEVALDMLDRGLPTEQVRRAAAPHFIDRPQRSRPDDRRPLAPPDLDRLMDFIERHNPTLAGDLRLLRDTDPGAFRDKLAEIAPRVEAAMRKAEQRPERFSLLMQFRQAEHRARRIARHIVDTGDDAPPELMSELRAAVAEGFEARAALARLEIEELGRRVDEIQRRTTRWREHRESLIDEHVTELLRQAETGEFPPARRRWRDRFDEDNPPSDRPGPPPDRPR